MADELTSRDLLDPAPLTGDPRDPRMQVGLVLEEVQVPPSLVLAFESRTAGGAAHRAGGSSLNHVGRASSNSSVKPLSGRAQACVRLAQISRGIRANPRQVLPRNRPP
jgi:hypothetical protein